jgi:hypothetical protein
MTLELSPELEREIEAAARLRGTDAHAFGIEAIRRALDPDAALDALLDTLLDNRAAKGLPPLEDEQLSRAAFYDEEGDGEEA